MLELEQLSADDRDDDGSSSSTSYVFPILIYKTIDVPIPSEAIFTNNNCTITLDPYV